MIEVKSLKHTELDCGSKHVVNGESRVNSFETPNKKHRTDEKYPDSVRTVSLYLKSIKHPLNVKPSGNSYLPVSRKEGSLSKLQQMGFLGHFPDELIFTLLGYVDDKLTLKNLSHTSRVMYAYLQEDDLWKKIYIKSLKDGQEEFKWLGSWKNTVLGIPREFEANLQLPDNLVCADVLYRPFQCSQIDYEQVFQRIIKEEEQYHHDALNNCMKTLPQGRISRVPESLMSLESFNSQHHGTPFILTNRDESRWPRWDFQTLLKRFPQVKFRQEAVEWNLSLYDEYLKNNHDESPLYLFDCASTAMKTLRKEYVAPKIFQEDLFKTFNINEEANVNCRPDHAWLIVGPKRSGSTFHKDPNYTSAWNTALTGRKLWIMLPPDITPPGVGTDDEESEVTSPVGIAEWVISGFFNDALKISECLVGITFPGECMYVPSGWWHSVINLDDSVALTQNFVPVSKLANALNFFKNKRQQLSGFRPSQVKTSLDYVLEHVLGRREENEEIRKLKEYRDKFNLLDLGKKLENEDCGEIMTSQLPPMPIFELFKEMMVACGKETQLNEGLVKLAKIERQNYEAKVGKSRAWEKLTEETKDGSFSFGFAFDESDGSSDETN
jgi:hypothetical protein